MSDRSDPARGIRFVLMAMVVFAVQDGVSRHLAEHYPIPFFVMIRYWFFAAFVAVVASRQPGGLSAGLKTRRPVLNAVRGVLLVVQILIFVKALDLLGLSSTMALFALYPLLITLIAIPVLGETVGWRRFMAVAVGFAGMLVILRPGLAVFDPNALVGLAAAFGIALYSVLTRLATQADGSSRPAFVHTGLWGAAAITLIGPFYWTAMAPADWGWLGLLCVAGMTGHYCLIRAYDATEAVRLQPFVYLQPIFGLIIGWAVFGEAFDIWTVVGMAMIVLAGLYAIRREWLLSQARRHGRDGAPG